MLRFCAGQRRLSKSEKPRYEKAARAATCRSTTVQRRLGLAIFGPTEGCDGKTVDVTIPVEPEAAAALADGRNRAAVGRLVSRVLRPASGPAALAQAIAEMKGDARATGLSDPDIDAKLAAYNAERRERGRTG
jgi:hypothetical protein